MSEIPQDRYALIIGAMKCATTSLFSYLAEHPAIAPARIKEPEFFSRNQEHKAQIARYEDLWDFDPDLHRYAMEASTGYSKWGERGAAERIHAYGLRPRLVYVVRDPFVRIESHYNFMLLQNPAWTRDITDENLVQTSNYYLYAADYSRVFGRENLMILDYEALVSDPHGTVNRVCDFLGLAPVAVIADPSARNVTRPPKSALERRLRRLAPGLGRGAPEALKRPVRGALAAIRPDKTRLTPAQRRAVAATLAPDMARLQAEYGVDVARWGF